MVAFVLFLSVTLTMQLYILPITIGSATVNVPRNAEASSNDIPSMEDASKSFANYQAGFSGHHN